QPCLSVEATRVDNQRIAVPFASRITQEGGGIVVAQLSPIKKDLAPRVGGLIKNHDHVLFLNDLPWGWRSIDSWNSLSETVRKRIFPRMQTIRPLRDKRFCPGLKRHAFFEVCRDIQDVFVGA